MVASPAGTYVPGIVFTRATLAPVPVSVSVQSQVGVRSKQLDGSRCFRTACKLPTTRILRGVPENTGTSDWNFVSRCVDLENLAVENLTSACRPLQRVVVNLYTQGKVTSRSLWSRDDRHFVGLTRNNALS